MREVNYADLPKFLKKMPLHFSKPDKGKKGFQTYDRKEGDQDSFDLLEDVFKAVPKIVPMSVDIKDGDNKEVIMKVIDLLKKYDRFQTTVVGSFDNAANETLLKMDARVPIVCSKSDLIWVMASYFTGFLPYLKIEREALWIPYVNEEFMLMIDLERKKVKDCLFKNI